MDESIIRFVVGELIDGTGSPSISDAVIVVKDGIIRTVGKEPDDAYGIEKKTVDLSEHTVLPCLVDCHVHLTMTGETDPVTRKKQADADLASREHHMVKQLSQYLSCGVTAVRDGGDKNGDALFMKRRLNRNEKLRFITLHTAGRAWHAKGRYGALIGRAPDIGQTLAEAVAGDSDQIDHVKLVNSGLNSLTQFGIETAPQFELEVLKKTVMTAKTLGRRTMIHANGKMPVKLAVMAGCNSIEHGFFMGRENLKKMADKAITWVPTACTMSAYYRYLHDGDQMSDTSFADISLRNLDHQMEQISLAKSLGVTIALGTDAGSPGVHHGFAVKDELDILVRSGFSIEGAVKCATLNGSNLMGLEKKGTLEKGMLADFIALKTDKAHLIEAMGRVDRMFIHGREACL